MTMKSKHLTCKCNGRKLIYVRVKCIFLSSKRKYEIKDTVLIVTLSTISYIICIIFWRNFTIGRSFYVRGRGSVVS